MEAKREIECAAEHFTQIRASRRHSQGGAPAPGHVTLYVRVPLRVVGLVVGPKGATIKRIQQDTHTYIITPSREREPIFEVTGLPQNVEAARKEIEQHIYQRTGNMPITDPSASISQYSDIQNNINMAAAASVATRSSYGSLAQGAMRRPSASDNYQDYLRTENNTAYGGLSGLLRTYPKHSYSAGGSPPAASPSFFGSSNSSAASSQATFQPWSNTLYSGFGIGENSDLFSSARSSALSGASLWSSAFGTSTSCSQHIQSMNPQRDEGLGDSPPTT
uniref:KH domain-containing protein n=1 Tax=Heterorhabditis bacteriophora TaxID=37862 RepID=A0A1I7XER3_HETBA